MKSRVAIIGSGPTGIYTLKGLLSSTAPLSLTIFEIEAEVGKGTPYHPLANDRSMLANIASIELPPVCETLTDWLRQRPAAELERIGVMAGNIHEREFYPRVVLGEYFQSQFRELLVQAETRGHLVNVKPCNRVIDIKLARDEILLTSRQESGEQSVFAFDHVVMATGHNWPEKTEVKPGYFVSPWPASALRSIDACSVGILGTSLSAIDALMTVATSLGVFYFDEAGQLQYQPSSNSDPFIATMMSRKGLLPEADFYCDYPYRPTTICTPEVIDALVEAGSDNLLDDFFKLMQAEITACDPEYAASMGLANLTADTFASAYFADREASDPFAWAARNLAEAKQNKREKRTIEWRYAILRIHEVVARAVPYFNKTDLRRFHAGLKPVFVDDYATVPHQSIERILALHRAGKLKIVKLGSQYELENDSVERGASVESDGMRLKFDAFVDATGQATLSAPDLPFPSLLEQQVVKQASTPNELAPGELTESYTRTGGLDLDDNFRPVFQANLSNRLYCAAISFLLHKMPFVQGITSAQEIGEIVSQAIIEDIAASPASVALELA